MKSVILFFILFLIALPEMAAAKIMEVDGAKFEILEDLGGNKEFTYNQVFRVRRLDVDHGKETLLKITSAPADDLFSAQSEVKALEILGKYIRAPKVYFMSQDKRTIEKEFTRGELLWQWDHDQESLAKPLTFYVDRTFRIFRHFEKLKIYGIEITDDQEANGAFDEVTGEVVYFDPGKVIVHGAGWDGVLSSDNSLYSTFMQIPIYYFLWKFATDSIRAFGDTEKAQVETMRLMSELGRNQEEIFQSIYGLNDFYIRQPDMHARLQEFVKKSINKTYFSGDRQGHVMDWHMNNFVGGVGRFTANVETYLNSTTVTDTMRLSLAKTIYLKGLPGQEVLQRKGWTRRRVLSGLIQEAAQHACEQIMSGLRPFPAGRNVSE